MTVSRLSVDNNKKYAYLCILACWSTVWENLALPLFITNNIAQYFYDQINMHHWLALETSLKNIRTVTSLQFTCFSIFQFDTFPHSWVEWDWITVTESLCFTWFTEMGSLEEMISRHESHFPSASVFLLLRFEWGDHYKYLCQRSHTSESWHGTGNIHGVG